MPRLRLSLRTLLILFAAAPVLIYYVAMRHMASVDAAEQLKDRATRRTLESLRPAMDTWLRAHRTAAPSDELILSQWQKLLTGDDGRQIRDAWGRPLSVGWRTIGTDLDDLYAKSNGVNSMDDGFGDNIGDDIIVHFWLPMYGLKRSHSNELEPQADP